jgi:regulatory protein
MGRITAIEPQARHANRFNLYIDNNFALGLSAIVAAKLYVGQIVDASQLEAIEHEEAFESAREVALRFLESRPRSTMEVRQRLRKKEITEDIAEQVITRLQEVGLLDDAAFAQYWVENREEFRPRAGRALKFELRQKGLASDVIAGIVKTVDEDESAYRAGLPRAARWRDLDRREFLEKLIAFLARRGFSYQVAKDAAKKLWDEIHHI